MSFRNAINLSIIDSTNNKININLSSNDTTFFKIIYDSFNSDSSIYEKIDILESISNSEEICKAILRSEIFTSSNKNIIEIFIKNKNFNTTINKKLVSILIKIFKIINENTITSTLIIHRNTNSSQNKISFVPNLLYTVNDLSKKYTEKSKYILLDNLITSINEEKEQELINFTLFLIELYNNICINEESKYLLNIKSDLFDIIIDKLDIGVINFIEEKKLFQTNLTNLNTQIRNLTIIIENIENVDFDMNYTKQKLERIQQIKEKSEKRLLMLNRFTFILWDNLIQNFVDNVINYDNYVNSSMDIINSMDSIMINKIIKIVYLYKTNQPFVYKNLKSLFLFIKINIENNAVDTFFKYKLIHLYYKLYLKHNCKSNITDLSIHLDNIFTPPSINNQLESPDTLSPDTLSPDTLSPDTLSPDTLSPDTLSPDKKFIENILSLNIKIYEIYPEKDDYIFNFCELMNKIYKNDYNTFLYIIEIHEQKFFKFMYILLEIIKEYFEDIEHLDNYDYLDYTNRFKYTISGFILINNLLQNKDTILLSYQLRNKFLETIFFIFNKIFSHTTLLMSIKTINELETDLTIINYLALFNTIIYKLFKNNYKTLLVVFSIEHIKFNKTNWENLIDYYNYFDIITIKTINDLNDDIFITGEFINTFPNECLDPLCNTFIECPIMLPINDMIVDKYILYKYVLEKGENPFNRQKITINDIDKYNIDEKIISKISEYKDIYKYSEYIQFIKT
jgi:hypothetical protein